MSNRFYFGDDSTPTSQIPTSRSLSDTNEDDYEDDYDPNGDDTSSLPFPKPLSRPSFLTSNFDPHAFLASLSTSNRFQTLEDLQTELRELSTNINRELVDLVNENYEEFVGLGTNLRGGEEKVEEVRVGLLGFEKDVKGLRDRVVAKRGEVQELVGKKRELRKEIGIGRGLLEMDERLSELEYRVGLKERVKVQSNADATGFGEVKWSKTWDEESIAESDEEFDEDDGVPSRIKALVENYLIVKTLAKRYDPLHPFLVAQKERIRRIQDRVRADVEAAVRIADEVAVKQRLIQMRVQMDD